MLFELSTALRFLKPNPRELARSLIALLSFVVIATISWLVVVFYSVTEGLEKRWIDQLVNFTGTIRLLPTPSYFNSYPFLIDEYSQESGYSPQTLHYHRLHPNDPWDEANDPSLPSFLIQQKPQTAKRAESVLFDRLEKTAFSHVLQSDVAIHVELDRWEWTPLGLLPEHQVGRVQQSAQLIGFNPLPPTFDSLYTPLTQEDIRSLWLSLETLPPSLALRVMELIDKFTISSKWLWRSKLLAIESISPPPAYPMTFTLEGTSIQLYACTQKAFESLQSELPQFMPWLEELAFREKKPQAYLYTPGSEITRVEASKNLVPNQPVSLTLELKPEGQADPLRVSTSLCAIAPYSTIFQKPITQVSELLFEEPASGALSLLAPKMLKDMGLHAGARVKLSKEKVGPLGRFEKKQLGVVVGFYDPGIFPLGGRFLMAPWNSVEAFFEPQEHEPSHDFLQIWSKDNALTKDLRELITENRLEEWFQVESYDEFTFSRDLMLQMRSDRMLLSLIAMIILMVACSSIASMLVLLVNERRREIALLQALGLAKWRLVLCFTLSGSFMGLISSGIGIGLAYLTLQNIDSLMAALSYMQGEPLLNPLFYGHHLPKTMSSFAIQLVGLGSWALSTLSGALASFHSARQNPANLMRSL